MGEHWPVLTVKNPWAWSVTAKVSRPKRTENRTWYLNYRGPMWWHAGARSGWDRDGQESPLVREAWTEFVRAIPGWPGLPESDVLLGRKTTLIPFGAVTALVEVTGCHHATECFGHSSESDHYRGWCTPWAARDQFHIELADVRPLAEPVPCKGALGLWRLPEDVEKAVRTQLEETP
jgi:hypothetical protein